jgi:endo-1,3(4)-beta-glucanase
MTGRRILAGSAGLLLVAVAVAGLAFWWTHNHHHAKPVSSIQSKPNISLEDNTILGRLASKSASAADLSHVAPGVQPPANSWLSGAVLQKTPQSVYPLPLSFRAKETGYEIGLPTVTTTPTTIMGSHVPALEVGINQAKSFQLSRYDKVSATLDYKNEKARTIASLTLAEGSPMVFYYSLDPTSLSLGTINPADVVISLPEYLRFTRQGHDYVIVAGKGASIITDASSASVNADAKAGVTMYSLQTGANDSLRPFAANRLVSVETGYKQTGKDGKDIVTSLTYRTANGKPTAFAAMPYQTVVGAKSTDVDYNTAYGTMKVMTGNEFQTSASAVPASNTLDLSKLNDTQKQQLLATLATDTNNTAIDRTDSYFAGKQLARAANLLAVAEQLQQQDIINQLQAKLKAAFAARLHPNYFYYDPTLKGIGATNIAFGSEDFNDHHFHYGYFIYAASILGSYDKSFVDTYGKWINLLAADYATYDRRSTNFPLARNYDPYAGHSWAAGLAPFADGNNQESSSEALQAWNAVTLWGKLTGNRDLQQAGQWMLANESQAAQAAWRQAKQPPSIPEGYTSPVVSLNFGGKRVYETFFSNTPSAKLGIQLIPLNPAMKSLTTDGPAIGRNVTGSIQQDNYNVPLGDYILMYLSLNDPAKAEQLAASQQDANVDDGNSRTYMNAWILSSSR